MARFATRADGRALAAQTARHLGHHLAAWQEERDLVGAPPGPVSITRCTSCGCQVYVHDSHRYGTALTLTCAEGHWQRDHPRGAGPDPSA